MALKPSATFYSLAVIGIALLVFAADESRDAGAGLSNPYRLIIAQNETQPAIDDKEESPSESKEPEIERGEKKEPTGVEEKPLEDFQPSEKIEAEQAVDFPYDI